MRILVPLHAALLALILTLPGAARAQQAVATFSFEDHLKRAWTNELVFYPVDAAVWGRKDLALLGPDGQPAPHQWATAEQSPIAKPSVAFLANVPEFTKATYSLVTRAAAAPAPAPNNELRVTESATLVELGNPQIALRLHRGAQALSDGPFAGVRLSSGAWAGGGEMKTGPRPTAHEAQITAQGPVFLEATATYRFGENGSWRLRFRIVRGEPVVLVDGRATSPPPPSGTSRSRRVGSRRGCCIAIRKPSPARISASRKRGRSVPPRTDNLPLCSSRGCIGIIGRGRATGSPFTAKPPPTCSWSAPSAPEAGSM